MSDAHVIDTVKAGGNLPDRPWRSLDSFFELSGRGTRAGREVLAGFTTFGSMSYILAVNPAILGATGMNHTQLIIVTALASMLGTLIMALWANLPIALAPGMGNNIIFAQVVVLRLGLSFHIALAMVFVNSLLFIALALTGWRERIIQGFPDPMRIGIQCGLGLFIAWVGLKNSGLLVLSPASVGFAALNSGAGALAYAGLLITALLVALRVPAALLLSIVAISLLGLLVPSGTGAAITVLPNRLFAWPVTPSQTFLALDLPGLFTHFTTVLPVILYLCISDFFGVTATLVGVLRRAGMTASDGSIPNGYQAFAADGIASSVGALLGTSSVGVYVESATGVEAGGRTGLTGLTVAALFAASLFLWPLLACIPAQATAPALLIVGVLMMEGVRDIDLSKAENAFPALLIIILTACTTDLLMSLATGCFLYTLIVAAKRQWQSLTPVLIGLNIAFIIYIGLAPAVQ
jgi:AGZA family xanthine/uracil permease-like MFS transporter